VLPAGEHRLSFSRSGYRVSRRTLKIEPDRVSISDCSMVATGRPRGRLKLSLSPADSAVEVDGAAYRGQPLPPGPHLVSATRDGFRGWQGVVVLPPDRTKELGLELQPTPYRAVALKERRILALGLGATGLVLGAGAVGMYLWNSERARQWDADRLRVNTTLTERPADEHTLTEDVELRERAANIQAMDDLTLVVAVTGGLSAAAGVVLWLSAAHNSLRVVGTARQVTLLKTF
jgi:hypothetical protein